MLTHHIHIGGLVQGVGFRPFVCRTAREMEIKGWVCNGSDGVHIEFNASEAVAKDFYSFLLTHSPGNALLTTHSLARKADKLFDTFSIKASTNSTVPTLLLTPDLAICPSCRAEVLDKNNRRYRYPFTTCLNCGPRYSIMKSIPYDRENTTMAHLSMCNTCNAEFNDIDNPRHFSQTNSCPDCAIQMHLFEKGTELSGDTEMHLEVVDKALKAGKIVAVKGIGGYLLLCDATNAKAIETLRERKRRPAKPFALLYKDLPMAEADVHLSPEERNALQDKAAPIVLCRLKSNGPGILSGQIAPGLNRIGIMLPYTALLLLISDSFNKPLIATSGNISGSPVIYKDDEAVHVLGDIADYVLTFDRDIVTPQDDSVIQFTEDGHKIILRRSRGLAPGYFPYPCSDKNEIILAMGAEMKSAFALYNKGNLIVSQFLGDQGTLESQRSLRKTKAYLLDLFHSTPEKILIDKHPGYFSSAVGREEASRTNTDCLEVQHHKAHFTAVLAENKLLDEKQPVLGVTWDGSGYGDDKQIWGSEFFLYQKGHLERIAHLAYFPQLLGDKMAKEPRLSALSLLQHLPEHQEVLRPYFTNEEWSYYQKLLQQPSELFTSSMGRFLDGIAALLGVCSINTYEGEAAMKLEALAQTCTTQPEAIYFFPFEKGLLDYRIFLAGILDDLSSNVAKNFIARKVFQSLSQALLEVSDQLNIQKIACSGGVFQNGLLADMVSAHKEQGKQVYFHHQLSPNDECIGFGQLAYYFNQKRFLREADLLSGH